MAAKPTSIKGSECKSGGCASKAVELTSGDLQTVSNSIETVNPLLRGWGEYYKRAHVGKLFNRLDRWNRATHLVPSVQALAEWRLETAAHGGALSRVRACKPGWANSFACLSA